MAPELVPTAEQQAIMFRLQAAITHPKLALAGVKREQACHRMGLALGIAEALPQQQHPPAFGIDRFAAEPPPQALKAASATAEVFSMQFGEPPRQNQSLGVPGRRFIRQGLPGKDRQLEGIKPVLQFRVAEVKSLVLGHRDGDGSVGAVVSMLLERGLRVVLHSCPWCSGEHMLCFDRSTVGPSEMHGCRVGSEPLQTHNARGSTRG